MNWMSILKSVPALIGLVSGLFGKKKTPPKRADEILGKADKPTSSEDAKRAADEAARAKYN